MIDWERICELHEEVGDDEFQLILELFLDEVEAALMRLTNRTAARMATDLHFLKGCAWNLGFRGFGKLCEEGERMVASGRGPEVNVTAMIDCYAISKQSLVLRCAEGLTIGRQASA